MAAEHGEVSSAAWENSRRCTKNQLPRYPSRYKEECIAVAMGVLRRWRVALLVAPALITRVYPGETGGAEIGWQRWENGWQDERLS